MKFLEVYFLKDLLEEFVTKFYIYWGIITFFDLSASFSIGVLSMLDQSLNTTVSIEAETNKT